MLLFSVASASGWLLVALTATTVALPFVFRLGAIGRALGLAAAKSVPFLRRMRPHYWLGYAIAGITLFHAVLSMGTATSGHVNVLGLYLATLALGLVFVQIALGRALRQPAVAGRRALRRAHLWSMLALIALGASHVALNSPAVQGLIC
jgi:hypothetical protein